MRLGTRWAFGSPPPAAVPTDLHDGLRDAEFAIGTTGAGMSWTLTWLEGRPLATLDDGTTVTLENGVARITHEEDPAATDDW